jgi:hypothetical protein
MSHVRDRGAQVGAQTAACGHATLPQQEKGTSAKAQLAQVELNEEF